MAYTFDQIFAADESNPERVAQNGIVTIFTPGDPEQAPLAITTVDGMPLANPIQVNESGYGPAFMHETLDRVAWSGAGFSGLLTSYDGMKEEAVAARQDADVAAVNAEQSRLAAEEAIRNAQAPSDEAVDAGIARADIPATIEQAVSEKLNKAEASDTFAVKPDNGGKPVGKGELVVNVRDYGAKGDGATDDAASIQAAVNAAGAASGPGVVHFPPGSYYIKHVVQLTSNITLQGIGDARIIKLPGASATVCFGIRSEGRQGYGSGASNIVLRGLKFQGDFAKGRACGAIGANHGSNILVEWCVFEQCLQKGHIFDLGGCENVTIRNCIFRGANYPTEEDSYNECIQADNSTRGGSSFLDGPGSYDGLPSRNFYIQNNVFEPITVAGVTYPAPIPFGSHWTADGMYHENLNFTGNTIIDPAVDTASVYHGILHFVGARNVNIENNTFQNGKNVPITAVRTHALRQTLDPKDSDLTGLPKYPLEVPMVCSDISVINNRFIGFKSTVTSESIIAITGDEGAHSHDVTIADNTFLDCGVAGYANTGPNNIELLYVTGAKVRGNSSDASRRLLYFGTVGNLGVEGNNIKKSSSGVAVNGVNGKNVKISGNTFDDYAGGILVQSVAGLTIDNNTFRNERSTSFTSINIGQSSTRFTVTGNDVQSAVASSRGILVQQASTQGVVRSNIVTGQSSPILVNADSSAVVDGNITT